MENTALRLSDYHTKIHQQRSNQNTNNNYTPTNNELLSTSFTPQQTEESNLDRLKAVITPSCGLLYFGYIAAAFCAAAASVTLFIQFLGTLMHGFQIQSIVEILYLICACLLTASFILSAASAGIARKKGSTNANSLLRAIKLFTDSKQLFIIPVVLFFLALLAFSLFSGIFGTIVIFIPCILIVVFEMMLLSLARRAESFLRSNNPGFSSGGKKAANTIHALCIPILIFAAYFASDSAYRFVARILLDFQHITLFPDMAVKFTELIGYFSLVLISIGLIRITKAVTSYKY